MTKIQKLIIIDIISAQIASDSGKGKIFDYNDCNIRSFEYALKKGYGVKPEYIAKAINKIRTNPQCGFNYYVEKTPDQNGYASILAYFDIKIDDVRYQVSFHTPINGDGVDLLTPFINSGRKTRWRRKIDSRESCEALLRRLEVASPR